MDRTGAAAEGGAVPQEAFVNAQPPSPYGQPADPSSLYAPPAGWQAAATRDRGLRRVRTTTGIVAAIAAVSTVALAAGYASADPGIAATGNTSSGTGTGSGAGTGTTGGSGSGNSSANGGSSSNSGGFQSGNQAPQQVFTAPHTGSGGS